MGRSFWLERQKVVVNADDILTGKGIRLPFQVFAAVRGLDFLKSGAKTRLG